MAVAAVSHASFDQGAAGTTALVAAPGAGNRIVVHGIVIAADAVGTAKLQSAATDLTGVMVLAASPVELFSGSDVVLRCAANEALNLVTGTSPASGVVFYTVESTS